MATATEVRLSKQRIESLPWIPLDGARGVTQRVLWHDPHSGSVAGMMRLEPGASLAPHTHRYAVHHVWLVSGACDVDGQTLSSRSYEFVPAGVEHGIKEAGETGCVLFYLFLKADMD